MKGITFEECKEQLTNFDGNLIFGYYEAHPRIEEEFMSFTELELCEALEAEFADRVVMVADDFDESDYDNYVNSYNYMADGIFLLRRYKKQCITSIQFHRYGDARCNYTDEIYVTSECDDFEDIYEVFLNMAKYYTFEYKGLEVTVSTTPLDEGGVFDISVFGLIKGSDIEHYEEIYSVYLYDTDTPEEIEKSVIEEKQFQELIEYFLSGE